MGLGLTKPELALLPLGLILLWLAIEGVFLLWAWKTVGREPRTTPGHGSAEPMEAPLMRVCQWCSGKGTLHPHLAATLGLISVEDTYEPECPKCEGIGYLPVPVNARRRKALRKRLVRQEWSE